MNMCTQGGLNRPKVATLRTMQPSFSVGSVCVVTHGCFGKDGKMVVRHLLND